MISNVIEKFYVIKREGSERNFMVCYMVGGGQKVGKAFLNLNQNF